VDSLGGGEENKKCSARDTQNRLITLTFHISVIDAKPSTLSLFSEKNTNTGLIFHYDTENKERHCVYFRGYCCAPNLLIGHNSWGRFRKHVYIENSKKERNVLL
jgi:hypothetical protein